MVNYQCSYYIIRYGDTDLKTVNDTVHQTIDKQHISQKHSQFKSNVVTSDLLNYKKSKYLRLS